MTMEAVPAGREVQVQSERARGAATARPGSSGCSSLRWPCLQEGTCPSPPENGVQGAPGNPAFTGKYTPPTPLVWCRASWCFAGQDCPIRTAALLFADDEVLAACPRHPHRAPEGTGRALGLAGAGQHAGRGRERWGTDLGVGGDTQIGVCQSPLLGGASSPPVAHPPPSPSPQPCLQALGQLRLVTDGAGTAVQAVVVAGQAAGCYLAVRAAAGQRG